MPFFVLLCNLAKKFFQWHYLKRVTGRLQAYILHSSQCHIIDYMQGIEKHCYTELKKRLKRKTLNQKYTENLHYVVDGLTFLELFSKCLYELTPIVIPFTC